MQTVEEWVKAKGLRVNEAGKDDFTLAHFAADENRVDVLEWLKAQGADLTAESFGRWTPMSRAAEMGHVETMAWLAKQGAADVEEWTGLLMRAVRGSHFDAMTCLWHAKRVMTKLRSGCSPMAHTNDGFGGKNGGWPRRAVRQDVSRRTRPAGVS